MKILVVGGGGREHAIVWKIAQSPKIDKIYCAPGNGGIAELAECVDIAATDIENMVKFARTMRLILLWLHLTIRLYLVWLTQWKKRVFVHSDLVQMPL